MKHKKRYLTCLMALVMALACCVQAFAVTVVVKYKYFVYSDQVTFYKYDYSQSTSPTVTHLTILAGSSLGSGSALYHMKYANGTICYCVQPGVKSDDSSSYVSGGNGAWYNLPYNVQSAIGLAMACGYPACDYGTASGDSNSSTTIMAEKWAATQCVIYELICQYRSTYDYSPWGYSPFYDCVDTAAYPTFAYWYDCIESAMQASCQIPGFAERFSAWADPLELSYDAQSGSYVTTLYDVNGVLPSYDFTSVSGSGITFSQEGNLLNIAVTPDAAKTLGDGTVFSTTGTAYEVDPGDAVICWYDTAGKYQTMAGYTYAGKDPMRAYIKLKAPAITGSIAVSKISTAGTPLSGVTLLLESSANGTTWTAVNTQSTDADGNCKWENLTANGSVQYRVTEQNASAGCSLLSEPLFVGSLPDGESTDIHITACNSPNLQLPFTGGMGVAPNLLFAALAIMAGVFFCNKFNHEKENTNK